MHIIIMLLMKIIIDIEIVNLFLELKNMNPYTMQLTMARQFYVYRDKAPFTDTHI